MEGPEIASKDAHHVHADYVDWTTPPTPAGAQFMQIALIWQCHDEFCLTDGRAASVLEFVYTLCACRCTYI